ncbi:ABC-2 family transporter [Mumia flava]|uniref:ABC-2 family transporter n=1 Tax=Mumia flava TaxID=1348852 RepID=A0A0B2BGK9_9ACTN|nr:ABC transporter permease subunit [Mumia flava]PJJ56291.1 ABC-2 family transporter [Mumia flava]
MTATSTPAVGIDLDRPTIPFSRIVGVELRKLADTRAGRWLLGAVGVISVVVMVIMLWVIVANDVAVGFKDFLIAMSLPMGVLLPVLGVLSVTSEWSQRTALVTFTLVPHRGRVLAAKVVVGLIVAALAVVVAALAAAIGMVLAGMAVDTAWNVNPLELLGFFALQALGLLMGITFGALLLSSPAAIVTYFAWAFVLPTIFGVATVFISWFGDLQPWIDFNTAQQPLFDGGWTGEKIGQLATSGTIWLVVPFVFGAMRVMRSEVK